MTSDDVTAIVARKLATWQAPVPEAGTTVGLPWTAERYRSELERLRTALVTPYRQRFALRETDDSDRRRAEGEGFYWVVAATADMCVWYDETTGEFGIGEPSEGDGLPVSIGLRGDLVSSFCAW